MKRLAALVLAVSFPLAACQQSSEQAGPATPDAKPGLGLDAGRLVLPAVKGNPGAAYFVLANRSDRAVTLAAVSIDGAGRAEIHDSSGGSMKRLDSLEIGDGAEMSFEPRGKHLMVHDIADTIMPGGTVEATLTFADGDKLSARFNVESPGGAEQGH